MSVKPSSHPMSVKYPPEIVLVNWTYSSLLRKPLPSVSLAYMGVVMEDRSLHWERTVVNSGAWRVSGVAGATVTAVAAKGLFVWVMALNWEMRSFVVEVVIVAVVSARASTAGII